MKLISLTLLLSTSLINICVSAERSDPYHAIAVDSGDEFIPIPFGHLSPYAQAAISALPTEQQSVLQSLAPETIKFLFTEKFVYFNQGLNVSEIQRAIFGVPVGGVVIPRDILVSLLISYPDQPEVQEALHQFRSKKIGTIDLVDQIKAKLVLESALRKQQKWAIEHYSEMMELPNGMPKDLLLILANHGNVSAISILDDLYKIEVPEITRKTKNPQQILDELIARVTSYSYGAPLVALGHSFKDNKLISFSIEAYLAAARLGSVEGANCFYKEIDFERPNHVVMNDIIKLSEVGVSVRQDLFEFMLSSADILRQAIEGKKIDRQKYRKFLETLSHWDSLPAIQLLAYEKQKDPVPDLDGVIFLFKRLADLGDPYLRFVAFYHLGNILFYSNRDRALVFFEKALEIKVDDVNLLNYKTDIRNKIALFNIDCPEADADLLKELADQDDPIACYNYGVSLFSKKEMASALHYFERGSLSGNLLCMYYCGIIYKDRVDGLDKALMCFNLALDSGQLSSDLAVVAKQEIDLINEVKLDGAREILAQAVELIKGDGQHKHKALVLLNQISAGQANDIGCEAAYDAGCLIRDYFSDESAALEKFQYVFNEAKGQLKRQALTAILEIESQKEQGREKLIQDLLDGEKKPKIARELAAKKAVRELAEQEAARKIEEAHQAAEAERLKKEVEEKAARKLAEQETAREAEQLRQAMEAERLRKEAEEKAARESAKQEVAREAEQLRQAMEAERLRKETEEKAARELAEQEVARKIEEALQVAGLYQEAMLYKEGSETQSPDKEKALELLLQISKMGLAPIHAKAMLGASILLIENKSPAAEILRLLQMAEVLGDANVSRQASYIMGMFLKTQASSYVNSIFYAFKRAADLGHVQATFEAGFMLRNNYNAADKALELFLMAGSMGHSESLYQASLIVRQGTPSQEPRVALADRLFQQFEAQNAVNLIPENRDPKVLYRDARDLIKQADQNSDLIHTALSKLDQAADLGHAQAAYEAGLIRAGLYWPNFPKTYDSKKSTESFARGAKLGHEDSQFEYAGSLSSGTLAQQMQAKSIFDELKAKRYNNIDTYIKSLNEKIAKSSPPA